MTDWKDFAERCLIASEPDVTLANEIAKAFMPRDDYPTVGTMVSSAIAIGSVCAALGAVEHLFPGWGCQVGHPLRARSPCGWYASIFRERRHGESLYPFAGSFSQDRDFRSDAREAARYAADPALAIMAALCRTLADTEPGTSALAA